MKINLRMKFLDECDETRKKITPYDFIIVGQRKKRLRTTRAHGLQKRHLKGIEVSDPTLRK